MGAAGGHRSHRRCAAVSEKGHQYVLWENRRRAGAATPATEPRRDEIKKIQVLTISTAFMTSSTTNEPNRATSYQWTCE